MIKSIARVVNVYEGATSTARTHTMTHDPVYPVMTFSEFLASKTYLGGKKNVSPSEGEATRDILFKAKAGSNFTGSVDLTLANCSLMTIKPGCQKGFLHSVPPQNINKGRRILLSYRKAADPAIVKLLRQGPHKVSKPQAPLSQAKTTVSRRKSLPRSLTSPLSTRILPLVTPSLTPALQSPKSPAPPNLL